MNNSVLTILNNIYLFNKIKHYIYKIHPDTSEYPTYFNIKYHKTTIKNLNDDELFFYIILKLHIDIDKTFFITTLLKITHNLIDFLSEENDLYTIKKIYHLVSLDKFINHIYYNQDIIKIASNKSIFSAVKNSNIHLLQFIIEKLHIKFNDSNITNVYSTVYMNMYQEIFILACYKNNTTIIKYLISNFKKIKSYVFNTCINILIQNKHIDNIYLFINSFPYIRINFNCYNTLLNNYIYLAKEINISKDENDEKKILLNNYMQLITFFHNYLF